jgi:hypothetical protein
MRRNQILLQVAAILLLVLLQLKGLLPLELFFQTIDALHACTRSVVIGQ